MKASRVDFDTAIAMVAAAAPAMPTEVVAVADALGRVAIADLFAEAHYPRFDCAAMDGYAFVAAGTDDASSAAPVTLIICGESRAGMAAASGGPGTACRISTGAPIPPDFDTVLPRERAVVADETLVLTEIERLGRNVRLRGEDALVGDRVLAAPAIVTPERIGALSCFGITRLEVAMRPRLSILPTGDELAMPVRDAQFTVFDANGPMIAAMARYLGIEPEIGVPVADNSAALTAALEGAIGRGNDIVLATGGVSVGDHDHVPGVMRDLGAEILFHGVSMRPGKPVLAARLPNGSLFFGLPGNPVAAAVGFRFFVAAAIRRSQGLSIETGEPVALHHDRMPGTTCILKARLERGQQRPVAVRIDFDQRSHTMRPLMDANCWLVIPPLEERNVPAQVFPMAGRL